MDAIKDMQKTDSLSRFLDQHSVRTNPFGDNRASERAYRRAERLSSALCMLTAHIGEHEPVRGALRTSGQSILECILHMKSDMRSAQSPSVAKCLSEIRYAVSLLRLATVSGFISIQNATTVIEALDELGAFISAAQRSPLSEQVSISRDELLDVGSSLMQTRRTIKRVSVNKSVKDIQYVSDMRDVSHTESRSAQGLSVRVQNILEILKMGGSLGIRDISAHLPEYSEKMIQRELLGLVTQGRVKKVGLKRWSKYSIAA